LFKAGELDQAQQLQSNLTPFAAAVTTRFGIGGLKAALDIAGYRGGPVRAPLQSPTHDQRDEINELLNQVRSANTFNSVGP
jgi:4-hydroxy-2-oxoglutarate aldolase